MLHSTRAFGGAPQRIRDIKADFQGQVSELLAKATQQGKLDEAVTKEDREILMQALRSWGALDATYAYKSNLISADFRGYAKGPGGGLGAAPVAGEPIDLSEILNRGSGVICRISRICRSRARCSSRSAAWT